MNYAIIGFVHRELCEGRVCSDEGFVRKLRAEAEAGDEVIEAVGVEKVGSDREVLLKFVRCSSVNDPFSLVSRQLCLTAAKEQKPL